jgi:ATP-binding cassette subfamily E protein 1
MRIAVLIKDRCQPKKCSLECYKYCPLVRMGEEAIVPDERSKPIISERLCVGCGICVHRCPYRAIAIVNLPEELEKECIHRYGKNGFKLYRLPIPERGRIMGVIGANGLGKSTILNILAGELEPNLCNGGSEGLSISAQNYLEAIRRKEFKAALKPQYVTRIRELYDSPAIDLLEKTDERGISKRLILLLSLQDCIERGVDELSGGELQRLAVASTLARDAEVYLFDEFSAFLDVHQRLECARSINDLCRDKYCVMVEHDLALLDLAADYIHILYGVGGGFGVASGAKSTRAGINSYLLGFLKEENVRFGDEVEFITHPPRRRVETKGLLSFSDLRKRVDGFELEVAAGEINKGEVVGIVGPNGTGKSTFIKVLAGEWELDEGEIDKVSVGYKPQELDFEGSLTLGDFIGGTEGLKEVPLGLDSMMDRDFQSLSGGERQRAWISKALCQERDVYLLDEPSAYLDVSQRKSVARIIRRVVESRGASAFVVDHDIYFLDMISESLMVFSGMPGIKGVGRGPMSMRDGMNQFLKEVDVTFRRDHNSKRPRINKLGSKLDREQRQKGEYYYG